jgi:hypothetical protein
MKLAADVPEMILRSGQGRSCPFLDRERAVHVTGVVCHSTLTVVSTGERIRGKCGSRTEVEVCSTRLP